MKFYTKSKIISPSGVVKRENSDGPRRDRCGTPVLQRVEVDDALPNFTMSALLVMTSSAPDQLLQKSFEVCSAGWNGVWCRK